VVVATLFEILDKGMADQDVVQLDVAGAKPVELIRGDAENEFHEIVQSIRIVVDGKDLLFADADGFTGLY
jgi:hypothetical protein